MVFDLGLSQSKSRSQSQSTTDRDTFIAPQQLPFLEALWNQTGSLANAMSTPAVAMANQLGSTLLPQGQQFSNALAGISEGRFGQGLAQTIQRLQSFNGAAPGGPLAGAAALGAVGRGAERLSASLTQPNPGLQGSLDFLSANIQENLQSTLGTIGGQAALAGASSGGRQALAIGQAATAANRDYAGQAAGLIGQDMATRQALAPQLQAQALNAQLGAAQTLQAGDLAQRGQYLKSSQQALQGLLGASQAGLGAAGLQAQAAGQGIAGVNSLFGLGMAPFTAAFGPLQQAADIYGAPVVLEMLRQQSTSTSKSDSAQFGFGLGPFKTGGGTG